MQELSHDTAGDSQADSAAPRSKLDSKSRAETETDLHKKLAAAKTKCARDSKRHQRARRRAEELERVLGATVRKMEGIEAENARLQNQNRALSAGAARGGALGNAWLPAGQEPSTSGRGEGCGLETARNFVPAQGYDTVDPDANLVLVLGATPPLQLSRRDIQSMTQETFTGLLEAYNRAFRTAVAAALNDLSGQMAPGLVGLVNEATALGSLITINNSRLRSLHAASVADARTKLVNYESLMKHLRLTPEQEQRLVGMRLTYLCTVALLANERTSILASAQDTGCAMDTAVGLAGEQLALQQGMEQLAHNLQRQDNYLCTFTEGTLREVLSPMQAAITFIGAAPWYPDVLAMANVVASKNGQPTPATVVEEASSIRLPSSVEAALRQNGQGPSASAPQGAPQSEAPALLQHDQAAAMSAVMKLPLPAAQQQGNTQAPGARLGHGQAPSAFSGQPMSLQSAPARMPRGNAPQSTATTASWTNLRLPADMDRGWHFDQQTASEAELAPQGYGHSQIATSGRMGAGPDPPCQQSLPNLLSGCPPMGSQQTGGGGWNSQSVSLASTPAFMAPQPGGSPGSVSDSPMQVQGQPRSRDSARNPGSRNPSVPVRSSIADMPVSFSTEYPGSDIRSSLQNTSGFGNASRDPATFQVGNPNSFAGPSSMSARFHMGNRHRFPGKFPASAPFPFGNSTGRESDAHAGPVSQPPGTNREDMAMGRASGGTLPGTLSDLLDMAGVMEERPSHLRDTQMSASGGLATVSSGMEIDFHRTWSPMFQSGSGRLPATLSFGLPLLSGFHKFPSAMSLTMPTDMTGLSPALSFMLPEMSTILAGVDANGNHDGVEPFWGQWGPQGLETSRQ